MVGSEREGDPEWIARLRNQEERRSSRDRRSRTLRRALLIGLLAAACAAYLSDEQIGSDTYDSAWSCVALGDVDGGGVADFALNTRFDPTNEDDAPLTWILSGETAQPLYALRFDLSPESRRSGSVVLPASPAAFAIVGDADGDGCSDFCVGVPSAWRRVDPGAYFGAVHLISGRTGSAIWVVRDESGSGQFGSVVEAIGDLDADGIDDLLISVDESDLHGLPGRVSLRSGASAEPIAQIEGARVVQPFDGFPNAIRAQRFGWSTCALSDIDTDGVSDFAVGASWTRDLSQIEDESEDGSSIHAYSGRTRELLWTATVNGPFRFEAPRFEVGDFDADGTADLLAGSRLLSGRDGAALSSQRRWSEVRSRVDLDGDGAPEWLIAPQANANSLSVRQGLEEPDAFRIAVATNYDALGSVLALDDWNGDGVRELAAVSNRALVYRNFGWTPDFGVVTIHSGSDGSVLKLITRETLREAASAGCPMVVSRIEG